MTATRKYHVSFALLICWLALNSWSQQPSLAGGQIDLNEENQAQWLIQKEQADGQTRVLVRDGREGRATYDSPEVIPLPARNLYIYFDFGGEFLHELPADTVATVTVTYWDEGQDYWGLEYDSYDPQGGPFEGAYTPTGTIRKHNSKTWRDAVFVLPDARFGGRQNGNSDFRLHSQGDGDELIDRVSVSLNPPAPLHHPPVPDIRAGEGLWKAFDFGIPHTGWGIDLAEGANPDGETVSGRGVAVLNSAVPLTVQDDYLIPGIHRDVFITVIYYDNDSEFSLRYNDPERGWIQTSQTYAGTGTGLFRRGIFRIDRLLGHEREEKDFEIIPLKGEVFLDCVFVQTVPGPYRDSSKMDLSKDLKINQPTVLAYFFYWYDIRTGAHIYDGGDPNDDALQDHPSDMTQFSYAYEDWFDRELDDVLEAGIDVILPVYWGATQMQKDFAVAGLNTLSRTLEARDRAGKRSPRVGLFFDTSTLQHGEEILRESLNAPTNLSTTEGKDFFYKHIIDFYSLIPSSHWATVHGKPLVWLYVAGFSFGYGPDLGPSIRERFKNRFSGVDIFLVADVSWGDIGQDATSSWGAAFGIQIHDVAAVGPGYDDRAVPRRTTPQVDREDGAFYRRNWEAALASGKPWVIVETWNEFHEGTDIAESREYGHRYIEITREFADRLKHASITGWEKR